MRMKNTIKSKERISWLFAHGSRRSCAGFLVLYDRLEENTKTNTPAGRVAFVAGKKLGTAPKRNKAKRRLREAASAAGAPWKGCDVVLVAQKSIFATDYDELVYDTKRLSHLFEQKGQEEGSLLEPRSREGENACCLASPGPEDEQIPKKEKNPKFLSLVVGIPRNLAIVCISIYRHAISPILPPSCRYVPSCSEYAVIALKRFGFLKGMWLSLKRVGRCHPFHPGGYDPVPEEMSRKLA